MITKNWIKLNKCKLDLIKSIECNPQSWYAIKSINKDEIRFLTGQELLVSNCDFVFFEDNLAKESIDISWLIFIQDANPFPIIQDVLLKHSSSFKNKLLPTLRSPILRAETEWVSIILRSCADAKVYAKYEGDDILVFDNVTQV